MESKASFKDTLITNIKTPFWYPQDNPNDEYQNYVQDPDVLDAIIERFNKSLKRRKVVDPRAEDQIVYRLKFTRVDDQIEIQYYYLPQSAITYSKIPTKCVLAPIGAWNDIKVHEKLGTPEPPVQEDDNGCNETF